MLLGNSQASGVEHSAAGFTRQSITGMQFTDSLPKDSHLAVVTSLSGLNDMEQAWKELECSCQNDLTIFQSFDWVSTWANVHLKAGTKAEILILAGYSESKLVFIWPLMISSSKGVRSLNWLTEPSGQYGDILLEKSQSASTWLPSAIKLISKMKGIDLIYLRHNRVNSNAAEYIRKNLLSGHNDERAPYLDLTRFTGEKDYDNRYTSAQRKRRKKIRKALEDVGSVDFQTLPVGTTNDRAMSEAISEKNKWLAERGRMNRILRCPLHLEFLKTLSRRKNSNVELLTSQLSAGGRPVSWEIAFRFHGTHFAYITSHVNELTDLSPGRLHMDMSQRRALSDGMTRFDLMVPYDQHKESWCSGMIDTTDAYHPITLKGRVYGRLYLQTLRPFARKAYYAAPQSALTVLRRLFRY